MNAITLSETTYNTNLATASNGKAVRRRNPAALAVSVLLLLAGIALLVVTSGMGDKTGIPYTALLVFGIAAVATGLGLILFGGKEWVYAPTGSKIRVQSKFIDPAQFDAVCQAIHMRDASFMRGGLKTVEKSGVRIDLYTSADGRFVAAQTFRYVPYTYAPVTPVCCAYDEQARMLSALF